MSTKEITIKINVDVDTAEAKVKLNEIIKLIKEVKEAINSLQSNCISTELDVDKLIIQINEKLNSAIKIKD